MDNEITIDDLNKFLDINHCRDSFWLNAKEKADIIKSEKKYNLYISRYFPWAETIEGGEYWHNINELWLEACIDINYLRESTLKNKYIKLLFRFLKEQDFYDIYLSIANNRYMYTSPSRYFTNIENNVKINLNLSLRDKAIKLEKKWHTLLNICNYRYEI